MYGDVVDAVVDEIFADGVVLAGKEGNLQFGSYAVGGANKHRITPALQGKARAEAADRGEDAWSKRLGGVTFDERNSAVSFVDIRRPRWRS